jgi:hypothetical protein
LRFKVFHFSGGNPTRTQRLVHRGRPPLSPKFIGHQLGLWQAAQGSKPPLSSLVTPSYKMPKRILQDHGGTGQYLGSHLESAASPRPSGSPANWAAMGPHGVRLSDPGPVCGQLAACMPVASGPVPLQVRCCTAAAAVPQGQKGPSWTRKY